MHWFFMQSQKHPVSSAAAAELITAAIATASNHTVAACALLPPMEMLVVRLICSRLERRSLEGIVGGVRLGHEEGDAVWRSTMAAMGPLGGDSYALRCVSDLPPPFRPVFGFRYFNSLQGECFPACYLSDVNMVVSAPTGSGKTALFELCILRLLSRFLTPDWRFSLVKGTLKTIYIAPMKALVQEKMRDWTAKLGTLGINCLEMTGDSEFYNKKAIHDSDLILTTPEKFDSMSRNGIRDGGLGFFSDIALVLIDEVHLLNDPRGASLEAVVSRIKMLSRLGHMRSSPLANVRFIAVSATISNAEDIG
ncbi:hypothetical protein ACQ4PT_034025 [Festuca glaucescens]